MARDSALGRSKVRGPGTKPVSSKGGRGGVAGAGGGEWEDVALWKPQAEGRTDRVECSWKVE